jgi:hypothetical protein
MRDDLIDQPSPAPTRKVTAGALAGALTAAIIAGVNELWPGFGDDLAPALHAFVPVVVGFVAAYFTRERV